MIQPINIKQNQFALLLEKPYSWKVLVLKSWNLIKDDQVKYIEVDVNDLPTGRDLIGVIDCLSDGDERLNDGLSTWAFCLNVSRGLDNAVIGESFIVT